MSAVSLSVRSDRPAIGKRCQDGLVHTFAEKFRLFSAAAQLQTVERQAYFPLLAGCLFAVVAGCLCAGIAHRGGRCRRLGF